METAVPLLLAHFTYTRARTHTSCPIRWKLVLVWSNHSGAWDGPERSDVMQTRAALEWKRGREREEEGSLQCYSPVRSGPAVEFGLSVQKQDFAARFINPASGFPAFEVFLRMELL